MFCGKFLNVIFQYYTGLFPAPLNKIRVGGLYE
jgi:hypothetical protein